ncbi:MAG: hypothetical protein APF80_12265 [Alphaproteobacteria bacterium BRH_c36]|nr:MAG: hypothetical protein APF80_12265 [Alphaproteobacteria bacterium BRH_c36]
MNKSTSLERSHASHAAATDERPEPATLTEINEFGVNPGALRLLFYAPIGLPSDAPLVIVLHGASQTAHDYAHGAGWLTLADRFGFAVLSPEQTLENNVLRCFNWFEPADNSRQGGEAFSIQEMVRWAIDVHALDANRVFLTGLSSGGAMTAVMLATYPEMFAAGAVISGLPYGAAENMWGAVRAMSHGNGQSSREWGDKVRGASSNKGPWPCVSIWHGDNDSTVRVGASDDLISQWTNVHGVEGDFVEVLADEGRSHRIWRSADGRPKVKSHRINDLAHGTPLMTEGADGCGTAGPFLLDVGISSSAEIARSWGIAD